MSSKQTFPVGIEYYETLIRLATTTKRINERVKQCGYLDPRLMMLIGEAESHLDDLRDMEEKGDI